MSEWLSESDFNEQLCLRVKKLREERNWTQREMAAALSLPFERYKKYETRTPLPSYLLPRFAQLVGRDIPFVLTGKSDRRSQSDYTQGSYLTDVLVRQPKQTGKVSSDALTDAFAAMLESIDVDPDLNERARKLASSFPDALRHVLAPQEAKTASKERTREGAARAPDANRRAR